LKLNAAVGSEERFVETLRKPSTGLKLPVLDGRASVLCGRDTQKTQHGIETNDADTPTIRQSLSRHSENPARD